MGDVMDPGGGVRQSIRELFGSGTAGGLTDRELLERFAARGAQGSEPAFAALVQRHGPMVLRVCRSVLGDAHEAEDAFQATFLILALKSRSIRGRDSAAPWLASVAHSVAIDARAAAARRRLHEARAAAGRPSAVAPGMSDDACLVVHEELGKLPGRYRAVLALCGLEGMTQHQAAERLGWPVGTVQSRLARGRDRLRARLVRRGLAPSAAVLATLAAGASQAAPSAALAAATVRLATAVGGARALASGAVPAAVGELARNGLRSLIMSRGLTTAAAALAAFAAIATAAYAFRSAEPEVTTQVVEAAEADVPDGLLAATGGVRMPDGSPAAGATVRPFEPSGRPGAGVVADEAGRFRVPGVFGAGCKLQARTTDGRFHAVWRASAAEARGVLARPIELTLRPAVEHGVTVLAEGRPAAGAQVVATGDGFQAEAVAGSDGMARVLLPEGAKISSLVAWHPELGVGGRRDVSWEPKPDLSTLSLLPPATHRLRVVDEADAPVAGVDLRVSVWPEGGDWIVTSTIDACRVRTGADGTAVVPWAPREPLKAVEVDIDSDEWKVDDAQIARGGGATTVRALPMREVRGRLVMPNGEDARGILVSGFGFGRTDLGVQPFVRTGRDGSFRFRAPADHGFVLGVVDLRWAGDPWTGLAVPRNPNEAADIAIRVYPATPFAARVTRGPGREPVPGAHVWLRGRRPFEWVDGDGRKHSADSGVGDWLTTDGTGLAKTGLGRGEYQVTLHAGKWSEERTVRVTADEPVEVDFHRDWADERRLSGRLTADGEPYKPSPAIEVRAWAPLPDPLSIPVALSPRVEADGRYDVSFDAEAACVLFLDRERARGGYVARANGDVDVPMLPTATYAATLVDEEGRGLAGRTVEMHVTDTGRAIASQKTDQDGRFRFDAVPAETPLQFACRREPGVEDRSIFDERSLRPGEAREGDRLTARLPRRGD